MEPIFYTTDKLTSPIIVPISDVTSLTVALCGNGGHGGKSSGGGSAGYIKLITDIDSLKSITFSLEDQAVAALLDYGRGTIRIAAGYGLKGTDDFINSAYVMNGGKVTYSTTGDISIDEVSLTAVNGVNGALGGFRGTNNLYTSSGNGNGVSLVWGTPDTVTGMTLPYTGAPNCPSTGGYSGNANGSVYGAGGFNNGTGSVGFVQIYPV